MADFSQSDMNTMRQDAIRRVQEMQRRSQNFIEPGAPPPDPPRSPPPQNTSDRPVQNEPFRQPLPPPQGTQSGWSNPLSMLFGNSGGRPPSDSPHGGEKGILGGILGNFFPELNLDEDKIIIIILLIILSRNGSDLKLLIALGYLLL